MTMNRRAFLTAIGATAIVPFLPLPLAPIVAEVPPIAGRMLTQADEDEIMGDIITTLNKNDWYRGAPSKLLVTEKQFAVLNEYYSPDCFEVIQRCPIERSEA